MTTAKGSTSASPLRRTAQPRSSRGAAAPSLRSGWECLVNDRSDRTVYTRRVLHCAMRIGLREQPSRWRPPKVGARMPLVEQRVTLPVATLSLGMRQPLASLSGRQIGLRPGLAQSLPAIVATLEPRPDPFPDYARMFTADGSVRFVYKDVDERMRLLVAKVAIWTLATCVTFWFAHKARPIEPAIWNYLGALAMSGLYAWLVYGPAELYRSLEIKPDCMVLDDEDTFWTQHMQMGFPSFRPGEDGHQVLRGIYGTRWVEFLTLRAFDELDRTPAVLSAQIAEAMRQLWMLPGRPRSLG